MKHIEIIDLPDGLRELVGECELTGRKTAFDRNGRTAAVLVSWDEYLALSETIDIARDPRIIATLRKSEAEAERGAIEQPVEELARIRIARHQAAVLFDPEISAPLREALAKIDDDPITGAPLFEPLRGIWSHRSGSLRIVYRIVAEARHILILAVAKVEPE